MWKTWCIIGGYCIMSQMFYGDQNRWFVGLVIDIDDPLKLDRVKVRIQGIHT